MKQEIQMISETLYDQPASQAVIDRQISRPRNVVTYVKLQGFLREKHQPL